MIRFSKIILVQLLLVLVVFGAFRTSFNAITAGQVILDFLTQTLEEPESSRRDNVVALEGVPDIPWCKRGQEPKRDKCRNGSDVGA